MPRFIPNDAALARLLELAHGEAQLQVSDEMHAQGRSRVIVSALSCRSPSKGPWSTGKWASGVLAAVAVFGILLWSTKRMRPISYEVTGGSGFESGYVSAPPDRPLAIHFSDGSVIDASADTKLRVESTHHDGARVLVERGSVEAVIHHAKGSSWQFVTGPFEVHVVGTSFALVWEPSKEEVDISLQEGVVEVNSPLGQGPFVVRKGQRFHASLATHSVQLQDLAATTAAGGASQTPTEPSSTITNQSETVSPTDTTNKSETVNPIAPSEETRIAPATNTGAMSRADAARSESWSTWVSRGRFQRVVDAAQAQGVENCLTACSLDDLRALADAARYTGQTHLAEQSLLAIRKRASTGPQGVAAAFLLGRISESHGRMSAANNWYDTYLSESPKGEFAADSLAGKTRIIARSNGTAAARPLAMQYLQRYPNGAHADTARQIANGN